MNTRTLRQIVRSRPLLMLDAQCTVLEAARAMENHHRSTVLISDGGQLAGIFTERDATRRVIARGLDPAATPLAEVMTADPASLPSDRPLGHALHVMYEGGFRHLVVMEGDRPLGVVSARDVLGPELLAFEEELRQREEIAQRLG